MQRLGLILVLFLAACSSGEKKIEVRSGEHNLLGDHIPAQKNQVKIHWIAIAPYHVADSLALVNDDDSLTREQTDSIITHLVAQQFEAFYQNVKTFILPSTIMDDSLLAHSKTRYNANKILKQLAIVKPEQASYILAITEEGIAACGDSIHETGVAGLGNRSGYCSVVSTAALRKKLRDEEQFTQRLIKACMHEMGHNFGLTHCKTKDKKCFMRNSGGTVVTLDEEEVYLCSKCIDILKQKGIKTRKVVQVTQVY